MEPTEFDVQLPPYKDENIVFALGGQKEGWHIRANKLPSIWLETNGLGIKAMVIDTGYSKHEDMVHNLIKGESCVPEESIEDGQGHGTAVAGVICAENNDFGIVGVAPKSTVVSVKALDSNGSGKNTWIVKALDYAIEYKPDVVCMSLGCPSPDSDMHDRIKKLYDLNIPVVCAAGNSGVRGVDYPAAYEETIAVAAFDKKGNIASFSAVGNEVTLAAPGVDIYTTFLDNGYVSMNGTSFAAPFITGIICLLLSKHKTQESLGKPNDCKTVEDVKTHLLKYTIDKGIVGRDKNFGYGVVDASGLLTTLGVNEKVVRSKEPMHKRFMKAIKNFYYKMF